MIDVPKNSLYLVKMTTAKASTMAVMSLPFVVQGRHPVIRTHATGTFTRSPCFLKDISWCVLLNNLHTQSI